MWPHWNLESNSRCQANRTIFLVRRQIFMSTKTIILLLLDFINRSIMSQRREVIIWYTSKSKSISFLGSTLWNQRQKRWFLEENALRGERVQDQPHAREDGRCVEGQSGCGGDAQAVPVEAVWLCGRGTLARGNCGRSVWRWPVWCLLPFFLSQNPRLVHGSSHSPSLGLMCWRMTPSLHPGDCMILA